MPSMRDIALQMIQNNPNVANNPRAQEMIAIIQNGDAQKGQELAQNLCATYGETPEQAIAKAKRFFNFPSN